MPVLLAVGTNVPVILPSALLQPRPPLPRVPASTPPPLPPIGLFRRSTPPPQPPPDSSPPKPPYRDDRRLSHRYLRPVAARRLPDGPKPNAVRRDRDSQARTASIPSRIAALDKL